MANFHMNVGYIVNRIRDTSLQIDTVVWSRLNGPQKIDEPLPCHDESLYLHGHHERKLSPDPKAA